MSRLWLIVLYSGGLLCPCWVLAGDTNDWRVAENNAILQVYVGETTPHGTELAIELKDMLFYSNQRLWAGVLVNGRIAYTQEFNHDDSYIRVVVQLPSGEKEMTAYAGVIKAPEKIDPFNHSALWKAFVNSPHKPFRASLRQLPVWDASNPIRARRLRSTTRPEGAKRARTTLSFAYFYPQVKPEERSQKAREVLDPTTGDMARAYAVRALAMSGYTRESAEALMIVATDRKQDEDVRNWAAAGLQAFDRSMPQELRQSTRKRVREAFEIEKERRPCLFVRTLIAWGEADHIRETLGAKLRGHPMEIEILRSISARREAVARLWEMHEASPVLDKNTWVLHGEIGSALAGWHDKRGIDLLLEGLMVEGPWLDGSESSAFKANKEESFRVSQHGTYTWLASLFGQDFGYASKRWSPELRGAIARMAAWWKEHRDTFEFVAVPSGPTTVPSIEAIR